MVKCKCGKLNHVGLQKEFTCVGCYKRMVIRYNRYGKIKIRQKIIWWDLLNF